MNLVYFGNSHEYLSPTDHALFKEVVGSDIMFLENEIKKQPEAFIRHIYSNEKFVQSEALNALGLHIYRIMLARGVHNKRRVPTEYSLIKFFHENGYMMVEDFLNKETIDMLSEELELQRKSGTRKKTFYLNKILDKNPGLLEFIKMCANVPYFSPDAPNGFPRSETWNHLHHKSDPQYKFHTDTFQPTFKCWIYIDDVTSAQGPLNVVPQSHILTEARLKWDFQNSIISPQDDLWNSRIQLSGQPGSFRVFEGGTEIDESAEIDRLGYKKPVVCSGKRNTFVAANTYAFHKRGMGSTGTERNSLSIQYRPWAFGNYK